MEINTQYNLKEFLDEKHKDIFIATGRAQA